MSRNRFLRNLFLRLYKVLPASIDDIIELTHPSIHADALAAERIYFKLIFLPPSVLGPFPSPSYLTYFFP